MERAGELSFYFNEPEYDSSLLIWKNSTLDDAKKHLNWVNEKISSMNDLDFETMENIKSQIFEYADSNGKGNVLWPLRVALSGAQKSPDPFTLLFVLGKSESQKRIENSVKKL
jgi:glutamyl/glutaminyl-tRNA synthetase